MLRFITRLVWPRITLIFTNKNIDEKFVEICVIRGYIIHVKKIVLYIKFTTQKIPVTAFNYLLSLLEFYPNYHASVLRLIIIGGNTSI